MKASICRRGVNWFVELRLDGEVVEEAGPFDDEMDAEMMGERALKIAGGG